MIEMAKANPDIESLKLLLLISGSVITLLLGIVTYFLIKQINVQEMLTKAVNQLTTAVAVMESQNNDKYPVIERRLNAHAAKFDDHEHRITNIEATCRFHHKSK